MDKPIAWYDPTNGAVSTDKDSPLFTPLGQVLPLYTQRTWVGLTDEERHQAVRVFLSYYKDFKITDAFVMKIEMLLKEKNT